MSYTPTVTLVTGPDRADRFAAATGRYQPVRHFHDWTGGVATDRDSLISLLRWDPAFVAAADVTDPALAALLLQAAEVGKAVLVTADGDFDAARDALVALSGAPPALAEHLRFVPLHADNVHAYPQDDLGRQSPVTPETPVPEVVGSALLLGFAERWAGPAALLACGGGPYADPARPALPAALAASRDLSGRLVEPLRVAAGLAPTFAGTVAELAATVTGVLQRT